MEKRPENHPEFKPLLERVGVPADEQVSFLNGMDTEAALRYLQTIGNRAENHPAFNKLLNRLGVPDDEQAATELPKIVISQNDIPESLRGPFVITHPNRETQVSFQLNGMSAQSGLRLTDVIESRAVKSRDELQKILEELEK